MSDRIKVVKTSTAMPREPRNPVTPEEIVDAIVEAMRSKMLPGRYSDYVPNAFHIYLCEDDLRTVEALDKHIRQEIDRALEEEIKTIQKPSFGLPFLRPEKKKSIQLPGRWQVEFHLNTDPEAQQQRLTVECLLAPPAPAANDLDGQSTVRAPEKEPDPVEATLRTPRDPYSSPQRGSVFARLTYSDDRGEHSFDIVKDVTKIGRYDPDYLTDVALHTKTDVGREHLVLRRNSQNGKFTATDSSKFGTWINGVQLRANQDVELPSKAEINLANVLNISFRKTK